ncbi:DUF1761 domain-containing protein [Candidatus Saccharibacteria bacterium]|jgi:hypothetical protein|nr:DUF1761 domain-containing protein [Candidatus Saccharibacteria bacterium]
MSSVSINILAVLVATITGVIINSIWYLPNIFGKVAARLEGKKLNQDKLSTLQVAQLIISNLIMAYVLAHFVSFAVASMGLSGSLTDGAMVGAWTWLGFIATSHLSELHYNKQSFELWTIKTGQYLVSLIIMGAIITAL